MRYFTDEHVEGADRFMCARADDNGVDVRRVDAPTVGWLTSGMNIEILEKLVAGGTIKEIDDDPFKEYDCQDDN